MRLLMALIFLAAALLPAEEAKIKGACKIFNSLLKQETMWQFGLLNSARPDPEEFAAGERSCKAENSKELENILRRNDKKIHSLCKKRMHSKLCEKNAPHFPPPKEP
jgi:hypothetical protein